MLHWLELSFSWVSSHFPHLIWCRGIASSKLQPAKSNVGQFSRPYPTWRSRRWRWGRRQCPCGSRWGRRRVPCSAGCPSSCRSLEWSWCSRRWRWSLSARSRESASQPCPVGDYFRQLVAERLGFFSSFLAPFLRHGWGGRPQWHTGCRWQEGRPSSQLRLKK